MELLFWLLFAVALLLFSGLLLNLVLGLRNRHRSAAQPAGEVAVGGVAVDASEEPATRLSPLLDGEWLTLFHEIERQLPAGYTIHIAPDPARVHSMLWLAGQELPSTVEMMICDRQLCPAVAILSGPAQQQPQLTIAALHFAPGDSRDALLEMLRQQLIGTH